MDTLALIKKLDEIDLELLEFYDAWDELKCGRYMGDEDSLLILNEIRKLELAKQRLINQHPLLLQERI